MTRCARSSWLVVALAVSACGGGSSQQPAQAGSTAVPPAVSPVNAATAGAISGRAVFAGRTPAPQSVSMRTDPNCLPGESQVETVTVGPDGGLANVFVYVKDGLGERRFPAPATAAVLDQRGCLYTPRVIGVQVGQPLDVLNSDPTLHNVHAVPQTNREVNTAQPARSLKMTHTFTATEVMVPFKCDVHPWMTAWVGVLDHPFFAVTGPDGSFDLKGLPPGTYTVEAWHETLGRQVATVSITEKTTATTAFTFSAPPAGASK